MTRLADDVVANRPQTRTTLLSEAMLARFAERAPRYDAENRFAAEDFEDVRQAGYLLLNVPTDLGGHGQTLAQVAREQRRLAYHAAPTALAVNMHLYWTGIAADLWHAGDRSLQWLLEEAARGEVFAAGHAKSGNDVPVLLSTTRAERVEGGYRFTGRKSFGSLTPVWTYLGIHGMDVRDPAAPKVVHGFMPRNTEGYRIEDTWDVPGMRATASHDTVLDGTFVPDRYIARVVPAGAAGIDHVVLAILAWALVGFGNVYYGLARRALDVTIEAGAEEAIARVVAPDVVSRRASARRRRDGAAHRGHRAASRENRRGLVEGRRSWCDLAGEDLCRQASRGRGVVARGRSCARCGRRVGDLPSCRVGPSLQGCPSGSDASRQLDADARDHGQDAARHQS
jgi:alkylation response protein AidB-like acyl-CoA dehydrogenase